MIPIPRDFPLGFPALPDPVIIFTALEIDCLWYSRATTEAWYQLGANIKLVRLLSIHFRTGNSHGLVYE